MLAYHTVHLIRTRLAARGIHKCWASIRESMRTWVRIATRLRQTDGTLIVNRQDTRPATEVAHIALFPTGNGLPLLAGGSTLALPVSMPARRSLTFRPARSLSHPTAALFHQGASAHVVTSMNRPGCYQPERQLLGGICTR